MRKLIALFAVVGILSFMAFPLIAQTNETSGSVTKTETVGSGSSISSTDNLHKQIKTKFVEGGVPWMMPILMCLIVGLAICIERVIYLNLSSVNTKKLLQRVEAALEVGGPEAAKEVCRHTRGPVASIFYQGLERYDEGIEIVEKSVISYGSVQMGQLEKGLTWISLFISLSPMLGFLGTVVGMIQAFDNIQIVGDITPTAVAGGIKVALITTVFGLIVAIILQVFYNYLLSKVDSIVNSMEDSSITLMDIIVRQKNKR